MDTSLPEEVIRYYQLGLETNRLSEPEGQLEFLRTQGIIDRYLPEPPAVVLDVGGGPGPYACWLARKGYEVHLIDPIPLHLEQAKTASRHQPDSPLHSIRLGDARELDFPKEFADVVLSLGPLYHLTERPDRIGALREANRVLKPGGLMVVVGISRFASTLAGLIDGYFEDPDFLEIAFLDLQSGQHRNPTAKPNYFTTAFFHHPVELAAEVREAGFSLEGVLAVEGAAIFLQDLEEQWEDPDLKERILKALLRMESEPAVLGMTGHLAAIGRKPI